MKTAFITGVTGQDGAYLTRRLLNDGYKVFGGFRRSSSFNLWRLRELGVENHPNLQMVEFDLLDQGGVYRLLERLQPEMVFNLAAQSFVGTSFDQPASTAQYTGIGALNLLEAIRHVNPQIRFYQASSSELYGKVQSIPQDELTPFYPRSPYAVAKLYAHWITVNYRESFGLFASSGILFNHESPLRGREFVTRKITNAVAQISLGQIPCLELGNMDAERDWGHADEYVAGMYLMLKHNQPDTFVLSTNTRTSVRAFVEMAFRVVDMEIAWSGSGVDEIARCTKTGREVVRVNPAYFRPAEVDLLIGDFSKAKAVLGWEPKVGIEALCEEMMQADLRRNKIGQSF